MTRRSRGQLPEPQTARDLLNWAGNRRYRAAALRTPASVEELQAIVHEARHIRALGTRHAFNELTDTPGNLVSLRGLPRRLEVDAIRGRVVVDGGQTYGELCEPLDAAGFALHNLASLPHLSMAGACATATHGSGDRHGSLATAVVGATVVRGDGELVEIGADVSRGAEEASVDPVPIDGAVVSLGALGIVVSLTLAVEQTYAMRQDVIEGLPFDVFEEHFEELWALGDSVSCFTDWTATAFHQVWIKRRVDVVGESGTLAAHPPLPGTRVATRPLHMIPGFAAEACTQQLGVVGPWYERLPHFRLDHPPSAGAELQSEYFVARADGPAAIRQLARLAGRLAPATLVTELRTIAADTHWLSPANRRDSIAIHFTWRPDWPAVRALLPAVERALEPLAPRPHWGKLFRLPPDKVRELYPERLRFVELANRLDPEGVFRNAYVDELVFGGA